jgi:hypothetical protein
MTKYLLIGKFQEDALADCPIIYSISIYLIGPIYLIDTWGAMFFIWKIYTMTQITPT